MTRPVAVRTSDDPSRRDAFEPIAATLPLDLGGVDMQPAPARRPEPVGAGLAGGVVAVRLADMGMVDGAGGGPVLVPRPGDG